MVAAQETPPFPRAADGGVIDADESALETANICMPYISRIAFHLGYHCTAVEIRLVGSGSRRRRRTGRGSRKKSSISRSNDETENRHDKSQKQQQQPQQ